MIQQVRGRSLGYLYSICFPSDPIIGIPVQADANSAATHRLLPALFPPCTSSSDAVDENILSWWPCALNNRRVSLFLAAFSRITFESLSCSTLLSFGFLATGFLESVNPFGKLV